MSTPLAAALAVLAPFGALICAGLLMGAVNDRKRERQQRNITAARQRAGLPPAAPDNLPGVNLADHDECALIPHTTNQHEAEVAAGCDRLWDAIRDHRTEDTP